MENKFKIEYSPRFFKEVDNIDNYIRYNRKNEIMNVRRIIYNKSDYKNEI